MTCEKQSAKQSASVSASASGGCANGGMQSASPSVTHGCVNGENVNAGSGCDGICSPIGSSWNSTFVVINCY